jgi:hypothetical protein
MKKLFTAILSAIFISTVFSFTVYAQEETLISTFDLAEVDHGGFGAVEYKMSRVDGEYASFVGGKGAWIIDHGFFIGLGGYGMANENIHVEDDRRYAEEPGLYEDKPQLSFGYGGLLLGYVIGSDRLVHATISTIIGAGGVSKQYKDNNEESDYRDERHDEDWESRDGSGCFVLDPTLAVEINVTEWLRPTIGVGYRYVSGTDTQGIRDRDLSGFTISGALKFGSF